MKFERFTPILRVVNITPGLPKLLIVDDSRFDRELLARLLSSQYQCRLAGSVDAGLDLLRREGTEAFNAILADYSMPDKNGLDLIQTVRELDPTLASIIVTGKDDKEVIRQAYEIGAKGFVLKGENLRNELGESLTKATESTVRKRGIRDRLAVERDVQKSQLKLLGLNLEAIRDRVKIFYQPWQNAGGDFISILPRENGTFLILASDVSGHDLNAAYTSVYFQGMARGMNDRGASVAEIFRAINVFLLRNWNKGTQIDTSIAALGAVIDPAHGSLELLNCGFPQPVLSAQDGRIIETDSFVSSPLGWFASLPTPIQTAIGGGQILFWSDGLEDLAYELGVSHLACAYFLLDESRNHQRLTKSARDDIVVFRADLCMNAKSGGVQAIPIYKATYAGDEEARIDEIQARVERSIDLALPHIIPDQMVNIILCIREALINGFKHGCKGDPEGSVELEIRISQAETLLIIQVSDSGPGHDFNFEAHEIVAAEEFLTEQRGLIMMKNLSDEIILSRGGCGVTMTFNCNLIFQDI